MGPTGLADKVQFKKVDASQVKTNSDKLGKIAEAGSQWTAEEGKCVNSTYNVLKKAGYSDDRNIQTQRPGNDTINALEDLKKQGWVEVVNPDPSKPILGSVVASFSNNASEGADRGSDLGAVVKDSSGKLRIGGGQGSGAYEVTKNDFKTSVYGNGTAKLIVPPEALTA